MWSTPALDPARNRFYIATGDAYSQPAARTTDAIMALAMDTGRIEWVRQTLAGDAWTTACFGADSAGRDNCPEKAGPDYDFGSAPALVTLPDGRRLVVAGQKSGQLHAVSADTGALGVDACRRGAAASSAASSGGSRWMAPRPTCRCPARSKENPARRGACSR